jgi:hypothetical protein
MLMPMPDTIWLARSVLLSTACNSAIGCTARMPSNSPSSGSPVAQEPTAAAKADVSIIPSMLILSTPARSLTISPMPASSKGVASRIDDPRNTANNSQLMAAPIFQ